MLLEGKAAIVTGAGSGMGRAVSLLFAREGARVAAVDINEEACRKTAAEIGERAFAVPADVSCDSSVKTMVEQTLARFGRIDILVNNAGVPMAFTPIEQVPEAQWDRVMDVNAKSVYLTAKHVVPHMKAQRSGVIINTASIAAVRPRPGLSAYCASKGAVILLTQALAIELAPYRIRVNAINPGPADTPMLPRFLNGEQEQSEQDVRDVFLSSVPLGELIQPDDIAQAALYLASDMARRVTGAVLNVDGGRGV